MTVATSAFTALPRGSTLIGPSAAIDVNDNTRVRHEGVVGVYEHENPVARQVLSGRKVLGVLMRNMTEATVYAGQAVTHLAGHRGRRFGGITTVEGEEAAGIVDDQLPASGCRYGDYCMVMIEGPVLCRLSAAADPDEGDLLIATDESDPVGDGGTLTEVELDNKTTADVVRNSLGRAMGDVSPIAGRAWIDLNIAG